MPRSWIPIATLTAVAFGLRVFSLGFTFVSSDDIELAHYILANPGFDWMRGEPYGYLINFYTKLFAGFLALAGVSMTEFWWRLPIALAGTLTVPIVWRGCRAMNLGQATGLAAAAVVASAPIHVYYSRYLWGYEVLGFLFLFLFLASLVSYFRTQRPVARILSPLFLSLYLISHGYIVPIFGVMILFPLLYCPQGHRSVLLRFREGLKRFGETALFVPPLIFFPLYRPALAHAMNKPTQLGLYTEHLWEIVQNIGLFYVLAMGMILVAFAYHCLRSRSYPRHAIELCAVFLLVAGAYIAPILFGAPPGITISRAYLLISCLFLPLAALIAAEYLNVWKNKRMLLALMGVWALTTWGTIESMYLLDQSFDPAMITKGRGAVYPDSGPKALGYIFRRDSLLAPNDRLLLLGNAYEPSNVIYYFGFFDVDLVPVRAFYDLNNESRDIMALQANSAWATVIAMDPRQYLAYGPFPGFALTQRLLYRGQVTQYLIRRTSEAPEVMDIDVENLNESFDEEFGPLISQRIVQVW